MLTKALEDPSDYVKTSAIVALGKLGTEQAIPPLQRFVDAPNLSIRQEAIYALHALSGGKRADLIHDKLFLTSKPAVRRRAAIELGKAGDARARDFLIACLEQHSCAIPEVEAYVRRDRSPAVSGRVLLAWARGHEELTDLLAELRPQGTLPIAVSSVDAAMARSDIHAAAHAVDLVGDLGDASALPRIAGRLAEADAWLRVHAAVALARLGDAGADARLLADLDNFPAQWLPGFAEALQRIREQAAQARLTPELMRREKGPDVDIALAAAASRLAWDPEAAIFRFLDALAAPGARERELAARYLQRNRAQKVTWLLRRALSRESREDVRDRLRELLVGRE
jgi:HEAT repeat protein